MSEKINWGIIGAGKIAGKFATDLATLPDANLYAIASRSEEKAANFAETYGFQKTFGSYESMLQDPAVQAVYIATPHVYHCHNTLMALDHKKAVICEKPFAMNTREVKEMLAKAKATDTFLMDALWTLCLPHIIKAKEIVDSGQLGKIVSVKADFGFNANFDPNSRLFNRDLGGGALLDIGIYPLLLALYFLGKPEKIAAVAKMGNTKIDEECAIFLSYTSGQTANLHATLLARTPTEAHIYCEKGFIHIPTQFHKPVEAIKILEYDGLKETNVPFDVQSIGYKYEAAEMMNCMRAGKKESDIIPHQFSLDLMELLDKVREQIGLIYPRHD